MGGTANHELFSMNLISLIATLSLFTTKIEEEIITSFFFLFTTTTADKRYHMAL